MNRFAKIHLYWFQSKMTAEMTKTLVAISLMATKFVSVSSFQFKGIEGFCNACILCG